MIILDLVKRRVAGRHWTQPLWETLYRVSLYGMNFGPVTVSDSGEAWLLKRLADVTGAAALVIVDVGANVGDYADAALRTSGSRAKLFCLEPSPAAFEALQHRLGTQARCFQLGLSNKPGTVSLYAPDGHSALGSLYQRRWDLIGMTAAQQPVTMTTLDLFCRQQNIAHVDLLKIDVEGHELAVLQGADKLLVSNAVDLIQFEFGGTHIDSRVFFRDLFDLLTGKGYALFRLLRDGLRPIDVYSENLEIFLTVNYVAIRRGCDFQGTLMT